MLVVIMMAMSSQIDIQEFDNHDDVNDIHDIHITFVTFIDVLSTEGETMKTPSVSVKYFMRADGKKGRDLLLDFLLMFIVDDIVLHSRCSVIVNAVIVDDVIVVSMVGETSLSASCVSIVIQY